jgi:hypothetical protein
MRCWIIVAVTLQKADHMATEELVTSNLPRPGPDAGRVVDLVVKATVVLAAFLYGCGFLVVCLHQYSYGLVETNPFRPRMLAAGIWFLGFIAVPFLLVNEGRTIKSPSPGREEWLRRRSTGFFFSSISCFWLGMILGTAFNFQIDAGPRWPSTGTIFLTMAVSAALVTADQWKRFPRWLAVLASLAFGGLLIFCGVRDLISYHGKSAASVAIWFIGLSFFASSEMQSRSWRFQAGNWIQSFALSITAVGVFASLYYPQIKPSWGGGAPVPATIYVTKDSLVLPGRSISAKVLDETDSGYYIIGGDDKRATFIPRSEVAMVYYSDDASGSFVAKTK